MSQQALLEVRLDACHGMPPMDARALRFFCRQNVTSADAVRAAELQGRQDRATGVRCMCAFCEGNSNEIGEGAPAPALRRASPCTADRCGR